MTNKLLDTFGKRVRLLRSDLGLTQDQLTVQLAQNGVKVGQTYLSELERTERVPSGEVVAALAQTLHTTTDYLLRLSDDPFPESGTNTRLVIETKSQAERRLLEEIFDLLQDMTPEKQQLVVEMIGLLRKAGQK